MSEQPAGEKSFDPTPKRRRDAAKKGDVLRSKEAGTAMAMLIGTSWLYWGAPGLMAALEGVARDGFAFRPEAIAHFAPGRRLTEMMLPFAWPLASLGLAIMLAVLAIQLAVPDGRFVADNLKPKGSRLSPIKGLKRMFGPQGMIELGKSIAKLVVLGGIAGAWVWWTAPRLAGLGRGALGGQLTFAWDAIVQLSLLLTGGLVLIALADWPIQHFQQMKRLKMTMQELRDETKESEGSPEKKAAIRSRQRQAAAGGVAMAMKDAQFVLTNPTHFAVALAYDPAKAAAPLVLARGRGDKALAMRDLAADARVPALEYPALARAIYFTTREHQPIRAELYAPIAAILAFVLSVKRGERPVRPRVAVPQALHFDAEGRLLG